jgi:hypothetical protein
LVRQDVANEQVRAMTFIHPKFKTFTHEHEEVINNECWYNDGRPSLGRSFSKQKTIQRHQHVIGILRRAAKREAKAGNDLIAAAMHAWPTNWWNCLAITHPASNATPELTSLISNGEYWAGCRDR